MTLIQRMTRWILRTNASYAPLPGFDSIYDNWSKEHKS